MMTYFEIHKSLSDITREKCNECKTRLDIVSKENVTERKALQLEYGMYSFCGNCGMLFNSRDVSKSVMIRKHFLEGIANKYPLLYEFYDNLSEQEKFKFIAATQAELYIRDQWLGTQYAELAAAEATGDTKKTFEFKIKVASALCMFDLWETWRIENNVFPGIFKEGLK